MMVPVMSMFSSKEDCYKARDEYFQDQLNKLIDTLLEELGEVTTYHLLKVAQEKYKGEE